MPCDASRYLLLQSFFIHLTSGKFPGLYEIPLEIYKGNDGTKCSLFDENGCWKQLESEADSYKYFKDNFDRHFSNGTTSPFHMAGHLPNLMYGANENKRKGIYYIKRADLPTYLGRPSGRLKMSCRDSADLRGSESVCSHPCIINIGNIEKISTCNSSSYHLKTLIFIFHKR